MNIRLDGKLAVVTGASGAIGGAIVRELAASGAHCLLVARNAVRLDELTDAISSAHRTSAARILADLTTTDGVTAVTKAVDRPLDILINSAGAARAGAFLELDDEAWYEGFALKLHGAVRLIRALWPRLVEAKGSVVNIVGMAARTPDPNFAIGGAVNAAFANVSRSLATLGLRDEVNVNTIHPGPTLSPRLETLLAQRAAANGTSIETERALQATAAGAPRLAEPRDIATLAVFLCSGEARHINGAAIPVDGGANRAVG